METQEYAYCCEKKKKCRKISCFGIIILILSILFAVVIGGLIGAAIAEFIMGAMAAIIVLAIVLGILLILTSIFAICKCLRNKEY